MIENKKEKVKNLELCILSCLLKKPALMNELILDDKYFTKTKIIWSFMKSFYERFKTFDVVLMASMPSNSKNMIIEQIIYTYDTPAFPALFKEYQEQLIYLYNQEKKEKFIIENIYNLANDLMMRLITAEEFDEKYQKIKSNAEIIYNEVMKK